MLTSALFQVNHGFFHNRLNPYRHLLEQTDLLQHVGWLSPKFSIADFSFSRTSRAFS